LQGVDSQPLSSNKQQQDKQALRFLFLASRLNHICNNHSLAVSQLHRKQGAGLLYKVVLGSNSSLDAYSIVSTNTIPYTCKRSLLLNQRVDKIIYISVRA
jgi:hypothetical protein